MTGAGDGKLTLPVWKTARFERLEAVVAQIATDQSIVVLPMADLILRLNDLSEAGHLIVADADGLSVTIDLHPYAIDWLADFMALPGAKTFAPPPDALADAPADTPADTPAGQA
jgi:hypothetical protein